MGIQCKLSTTNGWWAELWWKCITNGWGCNVETPSAELCSCRRDKHVMAFCWTKIYPNRNTCDWDADVVEVGRTVLADTVKRRDCYFELYSLWHWEPMKHVVKGRRDVLVSANPRQVAVWPFVVFSSLVSAYIYSLKTNTIYNDINSPLSGTTRVSW